MTRAASVVRALGLSAVAAVGLGGCAIGTVELEVFPDGSGKVEFMQMDFSMADLDADAANGFSGLQAGQSVVMRIHTESFHFADLNAMEAGGMTLRTERTESGLDYVFTLEVSEDAGWYRRLDINEAKLERARKMREKMMTGSPQAGMFMDENALEAVQLQLKFPCNVLDAVILEPADAPPAWMEWTAPDPDMAEFGSDMSGSNEVKFSVPVAEVKSAAVPKLVVRFRLDESVRDDVKSAWAEARKELKERNKVAEPAPGEGGEGGEAEPR